MQKLYCYVDENGMETEGRIFIIAVLVLEDDPEVVMKYCEELERESGKGKFKWGKAEKARRLNYLRRAFKSSYLRGRMCYIVFRETKRYEASTIEGISRAIKQFASPEYTSTIYVDGLSKTKRHFYGSQLRKAGIAISNIQGVIKDENNALVRLADAIAGFVRDALDGESSEIVMLFHEAERAGTLVEV